MATTLPENINNSHKAIERDTATFCIYGSQTEAIYHTLCFINGLHVQSLHAVEMHLLVFNPLQAAVTQWSGCNQGSTIKYYCIITQERIVS